MKNSYSVRPSIERPHRGKPEPRLPRVSPVSFHTASTRFIRVFLNLPQVLAELTIRPIAWNSLHSLCISLNYYIFTRMLMGLHLVPMARV